MSSSQVTSKSTLTSDSEGDSSVALKNASMASPEVESLSSSSAESVPAASEVIGMDAIAETHPEDRTVTLFYMDIRGAKKSKILNRREFETLQDLKNYICGQILVDYSSSDNEDGDNGDKIEGPYVDDIPSNSLSANVSNWILRVYSLLKKISSIFYFSGAKGSVEEKEEGTVRVDSEVFIRGYSFLNGTLVSSDVDEDTSLDTMATLYAALSMEDLVQILPIV